MPYRWDPTLTRRRYRDAATGCFISHAAVRSQLTTTSRLTPPVLATGSGQIAFLADRELAMRQHAKTVHL